MASHGAEHTEEKHQNPLPTGRQASTKFQINPNHPNPKPPHPALSPKGRGEG